MCNYVVLSKRVFQRSALVQQLDNRTIMAERPQRGMFLTLLHKQKQAYMYEIYLFFPSVNIQFSNKHL